uniref:Uncharacterized protein n=1 Tax=Mycena chlorophos TaxID=658473 RepID=A0ABQ0LLY3_MYCCL|nr:predicted protein [Mycena chlorophos]
MPPPFKIAKKAPFKVSASTLETEFGANNFLHHLRTFLEKNPDLEIPCNFDSIQTTFPVYNRVTIYIPPVVQVSKFPISDPIRATRPIPARDLKKAIPAHFDTILARPDGPPKRQVKRLSIEGLIPGRVRAIFMLPSEYGVFSTPLAYVEWYRPLTSRDETLGMFKITAATRQNQRHASIIPVSYINRSCHLIPKYPRLIPLGITSENALDKVKEFYLNPYLRHIDFVLLRGVE